MSNFKLLFLLLIGCLVFSSSVYAGACDTYGCTAITEISDGNNGCLDVRKVDEECVDYSCYYSNGRLYCPCDEISYYLCDWPMPSLTDPLIFDANFYHEYHNFPSGWGYADLVNHWLNYGIYEGRKASRQFDLKFYE